MDNYGLFRSLLLLLDVDMCDSMMLPAIKKALQIPDGSTCWMLLDLFETCHHGQTDVSYSIAAPPILCASMTSSVNLACGVLAYVATTSRRRSQLTTSPVYSVIDFTIIYFVAILLLVIIPANNFRETVVASCQLLWKFSGSLSKHHMCSLSSSSHDYHLQKNISK